jgi:Tol biopolymer transport system component/DNA-binding winged helix-turn-helix (wHTH) protein
LVPLAFGDFAFDRERRQLLRAGQPVRLEPKAYDLLALLLERRPSVLSKAQIRDAIWPATAVSDTALAGLVTDLRSALADSARQPRFIRTVHGFGYAFCGEARESPDGAASAETPALAEPAAGPRIRREPGPRSLSRKTVAVATACVLAAAVVASLVRAWRSRAGEPLRAVALTTFPGPERHPSLSPDGSYVTFTWTGAEESARPDVYVQMIGSGPPLRITNTPAGEGSPVWSPDGRWIAFLRMVESQGPPYTNAELRIIPPLGGSERKLADLSVDALGNPGTPGSLAWCPDSTCLIAADIAGGDRLPQALVVVSLDTGAKRPLTHPQSPAFGDINPAVSPDGRWLVFRHVPAPSAGELYRVRLRPDVTTDGEPERLTLGRLNAAWPAWTPNGDEIVFTARGDLWRLALPTLGPRVEPEPLPYVGEDGMMPVISRPPPGRPARLAYVRTVENWNIWRVACPRRGVAGASAVKAISSSREDINPSFSPDSRRVAFASTRSGSLEIWVADLDGRNAVQLTSLDSISAGPRWSPDGRLLAFQCNHDGNFDVWIVPSAGGKAWNFTSHPANDFVPSFSRDGRWVYFSSTRGDGSFHVWKMPVSGGPALRVTDGNGFALSEGPDGTLYYSEGADTNPVLRMDAGGGRAARILDAVVLNSFAVVEGGIYYVDRPQNDTRLMYRNLSDGTSAVVVSGLGRTQSLITATPDGRTVLFARLDYSLQDLMLVENFR